MATITVTELAEALGTDNRTTRKFLRSITPKADQPGKGSRWAIEKKDTRGLKTAFAKYEAAKALKADPEVADDETPEADAE